MKKYDVVIIGAGPAGSTFSRELSNDFDALLLDKREMSEEKPCAGLLVGNSLEYFQKKNLDIDEMVFSSPKKPEQIYWDWDNEIKRKCGELVNINRKKFDEWLYNLLDENIDKKLNTIYKRHEKRGDEIEVCVDNNGEEEIIRTSYLVGCDGTISQVRNNIQGHGKKYRTALQEKTDIETEDVFFIYDENINSFYSWVVPKDKFTIIGSAFCDKSDLKKFQYFKDKLKEKFGDFDTFGNENTLMTNSSQDDIFLGQDNVILCGEASGLMSPSSGEGISYALRSAEMAARAFNQKNNFFESYKEQVKKLIKEISQKQKKYNKIKNPEERAKLF